MKIETFSVLLFILHVFGGVKCFPECPENISNFMTYEAKWGNCDVSCGNGTRKGFQLIRILHDTPSLYRYHYCAIHLNESCNEQRCPENLFIELGGQGPCNEGTGCINHKEEIQNCTYPDCQERMCQPAPFISEILPRDHSFLVEVMIPKEEDIFPLFLYSYNAGGTGVPHPQDISPREFMKSINGIDIYKVTVPCAFCGLTLKSGIALVHLDHKQEVIEFVSFGGSFDVKHGFVARQGVRSTDTGFAIDLTVSIQRVGSGCSGKDFNWVAAEETLGAVNNRQKILY